MRSALTPDNDCQHRTELFNIGGRRITELVVGVGETPQLARGGGPGIWTLTEYGVCTSCFFGSLPPHNRWYRQNQSRTDLYSVRIHHEYFSFLYFGNGRTETPLQVSCLLAQHFSSYNIMICYQDPIYQSTLNQPGCPSRLTVGAIQSMRLFSLYFYHAVAYIHTLRGLTAFGCKSIKNTYAHTLHKLQTGMIIFLFIKHPSDTLITLYKLGKQNQNIDENFI